MWYIKLTTDDIQSTQFTSIFSLLHFVVDFHSFSGKKLMCI